PDAADGDGMGVGRGAHDASSGRDGLSTHRRRRPAPWHRQVRGIGVRKTRMGRRVYRDRVLRACVVGYGMMGEWHTRALERAGCALQLLVGRRTENARAFAASHGYERWSDRFEDALTSPEVDL